MRGLRRRRLLALRAQRVARAARLRHGPPRRPAQRRHRSRSVQRLRVRHGHRARRNARVRHPGHPAAVRERRALPGAGAVKISLRWLRDYTPLDAPLDHLVQTLVETGTEVGAVEDVAAGIVAARVLQLDPLPGSTHGLRLATIDIGPVLPRALVEIGISEAPVQVVTGAPNVEVGDLVAYAPPGSRPPGMDEPVG